jgi:hypothetical protein
MWRAWETGPRNFLTGHLGGNAGNSQGEPYVAAPAPDPYWGNRKAGNEQAPFDSPDLLSNRNVQGLLGQCALAIVAILGTLAMLNL